jgi:hypothetical protein
MQSLYNCSNFSAICGEPGEGQLYDTQINDYRCQPIESLYVWIQAKDTHLDKKPDIVLLPLPSLGHPTQSPEAWYHLYGDVLGESLPAHRSPPH